MMAAPTQFAAAALPAASVMPALPIRREEPIRRIVASIIDVVPLAVLSLLHLLPILGWIFYGLFATAYWLLRDVTGTSPGKMVLGSVVVSQDGNASTTAQRIVRNIPLALPHIFGVIPLIGIFFEFVGVICAISIEMAVLLATGRRIGDRLAGTDVVASRPFQP